MILLSERREGRKEKRREGKGRERKEKRREGKGREEGENVIIIEEKGK